MSGSSLTLVSHVLLILDNFQNAYLTLNNSYLSQMTTKNDNQSHVVYGMGQELLF